MSMWSAVLAVGLALPGSVGVQQKAGPTYTGSSRILFSRSVDTPAGRRTDIFTVRPDGRSALQLTRGPGERYAGSYSPDGSRIAFVSGGPVGRLWLMNGDGTGARPLGNLTGSCPRFSPTGDRIAYRSGDFGEIWIASASGSGAHRVSGSDSEFDQCPTWSPDGRRLAFVRYQGFSESDVWTIAADGTQPKRLTTDSTVKTSAAWSPDGRSIAFDSDGDIWLMAAAGTGAHAVTSDPAAESDPVWSRRSNKIAFAKATGAAFTLWVLELGKAPRALGIAGSPAGWRGH